MKICILIQLWIAMILGAPRYSTPTKTTYTRSTTTSYRPSSTHVVHSYHPSSTVILPLWGTYYMPAYYYAYTPMIGPTVVMGGGSIAWIVIGVICFICMIAVCANVASSCCNKGDNIHHYEPEMETTLVERTEVVEI